MKLKTKGLLILFILLSLCGQLSLAVPLYADLTETSALPPSGREQESLTLVAISPLVVEGKMVGEVVVYDDSTTKRPADYIGLYDGVGDLLAVGWFDKFGIQRIAMDRGLVEGGNDLEGVFVSLVDGDPI